MDMALTLNDDDTFDGSVVMAFSDELAESMGSDPQELWDQMGSEMESELPEGATQEPYAQDGYTGTRITYADQPISQLSSAGADSISVAREGDEYVVSGSMDMTGEEFNPETGDATSDEMTRQMMESLDIKISITFPGEVAESNGEVDGNTVTWTPVVGEVNEMSARGSAVAGGAAGGEASDEETGSDDTTDDSTSGAADGGEGTTGESSSGVPAWLWFIIGGVVLLAIIGVVLWLVLRSKPNPQDGQAAGFQQGGYPGQPGQYPGQPQGQYPGQQGQQGQQGQPGQYPGQQGQQYPGQQGQPGQYPGQQGQQYPGQQGQYPGQPGQYPGQPGGPQAYAAQPPAPPQQGGYPGAPAGQFAPPGASQPLPPAPGTHPQGSPTTPYPPAATQPLPPHQPPAPTQPLPPQPGPAEQSGPDDEIDDATRLRPPSE
jgi:hypothetical protein